MDEQMKESDTEMKESLTCTSFTSQYADVSVPLNLRPCVNVGNLVTECCGEPAVALRSCQGTDCVCGCEITITQTIRIKIPIEYGAEADLGDTSIVCKKNSNCGNTCSNSCYR